MTQPREGFVAGIPDSEDLPFAYRVPMTCFTEVRLSRCSIHSAEYGPMGIAVDRRFVLDRWGGPVRYVRNHREVPLIAHVMWLRQWIDGARYTGVDGAEFAAAVFGSHVAFLKSMSSPNTDDFRFIDEHEWRIVHSFEQVKNGAIVKTGLSTPEFRIPAQPHEIRLLVFPDDDTKRSALENAAFRAWHDKARYPPLLTLEDCAQL